MQHNDPRWGNLYVSDSFNQEFTLSLPKNRRRYGDVDFQRIEGLEGIYLANYYDLPDVVLDDGVPYDLQERRLKTVITVDKGAQWTTLPVPDSIPCPDIVRLSLTCHREWKMANVLRVSCIGMLVALVWQLAIIEGLLACQCRRYRARDRQRWLVPTTASR